MEGETEKLRCFYGPTSAKTFPRARLTDLAVSAFGTLVRVIKVYVREAYTGVTLLVSTAVVLNGGRVSYTLALVTVKNSTAVELNWACRLRLGWWRPLTAACASRLGKTTGVDVLFHVEIYIHEGM